MSERRLVGIDLGIASAHTVRVLREDGSEVCRRRCWPRLDSLLEVEAAALAGAPPELRLEVVIEPTGPAWLPIAVFFTSRGHTVYRVSSAKAADLRRFLSRHAKSNGIDAKTLARLPLVDRQNLYPVELPGADRASLDRRVRACDRLSCEIYLVPRLYELHTVTRETEVIWGIPLLRLRRAPFRSWAWTGKRGADGSPLMLAHPPSDRTRRVRARLRTPLGAASQPPGRAVIAGRCISKCARRSSVGSRRG